MQKAVFLDRDGVINVEKNYLYKIDDFEFIDGVFSSLNYLQKQGYLLFIITNQSGISRAYYTQNDFDVLTSWMLDKFKENNINISQVELCPHGPNDNCTCRKPKTGMIDNILKNFNIDLDNSWLIGDLMMDHYLWGESDRLSSEAPIPVIELKKESTVLGGAGNVIQNLLSLGSTVGVISVVGKDDIAVDLKAMLNKIGAKTFLIEQPSRKTSKKTRLMSSNSQVARYDTESRNSISFDAQNKIFSKLQEIINGFDLILISDYEKGVVTKELCQKIIEYANKYDKKVVVDPKGKDYKKYTGAYLVTPTKKELEVALKVDIDDKDDIKKALRKLKEKIKVTYPLVSLGRKGIAYLEDDELIVKKTHPNEVYDATGLDDTIIASLGYSLAIEENVKKAVEFSNVSTNIVLNKLGSATTNIYEIEQYSGNKSVKPIENAIKSFDKIKEISRFFKEENKKIVFTNGCFDILHKGHVAYLNTAKSFGDILIVGLNSDDSVKRLKGENRPVNSQDDRAFLLSALECVDYVVIFDEDTPYELIKKVKPDTLVKGADYQGKEVVGSDIAKQTKLVQFEDGKSTTNIINKIKG